MVDKISVTDPPDSFETRISYMVCQLEVENDNGSFNGSGFIYHQLHPATEEQKQNKYRQVKGCYIVTNRHVIFDLSEEEREPYEISINFRSLPDSEGNVDWGEILLTGDDIKNRVFVHQDPDVDIAVIDIRDIKSAIHRISSSFSGNDLVTSETNVKIECSDDIVIAGYPEGFYDEKNIFPIVKHGIVSSGLQLDWGGEPYFLVDLRLFPGSSGSVVITKPADYFVINGLVHPSWHGKQFWLLGIYSGEPYIGEDGDEKTIDAGIVWHARLFDEIMEARTSWSPLVKPSVAIGSLTRPQRRKN